MSKTNIIKLQVGDVVLFDIPEYNIGVIESIDVEDESCTIRQPSGRIRSRNYVYDIRNNKIMKCPDNVLAEYNVTARDAQTSHENTSQDSDNLTDNPNKAEMEDFRSIDISKFNTQPKNIQANPKLDDVCMHHWVPKNDGRIKSALKYKGCKLVCIICGAEVTTSLYDEDHVIQAIKAIRDINSQMKYLAIVSGASKKTIDYFITIDYMAKKYIKKYNKIKNAVEHKPFGMTMLTQPEYINSMRSVMFTEHLRQFVNLLEEDLPKFFTNGENLVGKYSSYYKKAKRNYTVSLPKNHTDADTTTPTSEE